MVGHIPLEDGILVRIQVPQLKKTKNPFGFEDFSVGAGENQAPELRRAVARRQCLRATLSNPSPAAIFR